MTDIGQSMIDNPETLLVEAGCTFFCGYATQQLRRLENALARDRLSQARKEEHILNSMKNAVKAFESRYTTFENGSIIYILQIVLGRTWTGRFSADIHIDKYLCVNSIVS